jgi:hypothetical protein
MAASTSEPFYMAMRIYGPEERVMNSKWALLVGQKKIVNISKCLIGDFR